MKMLLCYIFICFLIISCQDSRCLCDLSESVQFKNDSLIYSYYEKPINLPSRFWYELQEPNIFREDYSRIRLLVQNRINQKGVIYRIEHLKDSIHLIVKEIEINTSDNKLGVSKEERYELAEIKWNNLIEVIYSNCYYSIASDIAEDNYFVEGNLNMLEIKNTLNTCSPSSYQLNIRISPEELRNQNGAFLGIKEAIIKLSQE